MDGTPPLGVLGPGWLNGDRRTPERVWEGMRRCQLVVTGQSLFGGVHLGAVCQLVRAAQRGGVPAVDFVGGDAQTLPGDAAKEMQWKTGGRRDRSGPALVCPARL